MSKIFVFGSNLAGFHGAGAALHALKNHGAIKYCPVGIQGTSYAIPTKDKNVRTLSLVSIRSYVAEFINYAINHPELEFEVTRIGCGLAGYDDADIAPMFKDAPSNCHLPVAGKWDAMFDWREFNVKKILV